MAYTKTTWTERLRQYASRFILTSTGAGNEYDIERVEGAITEAGTPLSTANLNKIEQGIYDAHQFLVPTGAVFHFATATAPAGYLKTNGAAVSRSNYAALFAVVGTIYGAGDGSTTFNLPDLRGEFIRGYDDGRGVDSGRSIGSAQADETKSHSHTIPFNNTPIDMTIGGTTTSRKMIDTNTTTTTSVGGTETRPRNIALLACIKY